MFIGKRSDAKAAGEQRYFNGKPCAHGHVAPRLTSSGSCCQCWSERYERDKEGIKARASKWNKDNRERRSDIQRRSNRKNIEKLRRDRKERYARADKLELARKAREWRSANPSKVREKERRYRAKHPDKMAARWALKRYRRKGAPGSFTKSDIDQIRIRQKGKCAYCKVSLAKVKQHRDHIVPICLGGTNNPSNIQLLCEPCNLRKGIKHPTEFAQSLGMLL